MRKKAVVASILAGAMTLGGVPSTAYEPMAVGVSGYTVSDPLFTVGESIGDYTPPGVLDGMGAYELDRYTVRLLANHELLNFRGYPYEISDGNGGTFEMTGARISYFDIDKATREIVASGLAYHTVYDANGDVATDPSFLSNDFAGFSRLCSSQLVEPGQFEKKKGKGKGKGKGVSMRDRGKRGIVSIVDCRVFSSGQSVTGCVLGHVLGVRHLPSVSQLAA